MKLRWLTLCDKHGVKSSAGLQYWDEEYKRWEPVNEVECKTWQEEEYNTDPDAYY